MKSKTIANTYLLIAAAILTMVLGLPAAAQQVNMRFSGTAAKSTITNLLQPGTSNAEYTLAGNGALGPFTLRLVSAGANSFSSTPPATCSGPNKAYAPVDAGAGVFRFQDGSLLYVQLAQGSGDCIDFSANDAHCTLNLQITGGTGRFTNVSGTLTLTETVLPVLADALGNPVFFAATGKITGTVAGVSDGQSQGEQ